MKFFCLIFSIFPIVIKLEGILQELAGCSDDSNDTSRINLDNTSDALVSVRA
jgi:hypothetical protein